MNEENVSKTFCSRCGAEMSSNSRYCLKCGNLNYEHEANKSMRQFMDKADVSYQVGGGNYVKNGAEDSKNKIVTTVGSNTGNRNFCFFINYIIYISIALIAGLIAGINSSFELEAFLRTTYPYFILILSIFFIYTYSIQLIYIKANEKWWSGLIPVYNLMILAKITYGNKLLGLITLVPIIGQVFLLVMLYKLATQFKVSGLMTVLFSFIYLPIIGFGDSLYKNCSFVDYKEGAKTLEIDYKHKKMFISSIVLFSLLGLGIIFYNNLSGADELGKKINDYYLIYASSKVTTKTQDAVLNGQITCDNIDYTVDDGIYYINISDFSDIVYLPFYQMREPIGGYIKIDNTKGDSRYYISFSDGKYGMNEVLFENVDKSRITKLKNVHSIPEDANVCRVDVE